MLSGIKLINLIMSVVQGIMGMFRDEGIKQSGRDEVNAKNAARMINARARAYEKINSFDDAVAACFDKLPDNRTE